MELVEGGRVVWARVGRKVEEWREAGGLEDDVDRLAWEWRRRNFAGTHEVEETAKS